MKALPWIISVICVASGIHSYIFHQNQIELLKQTVILSEKARSIESDQVRDLMYALQTQQSEQETTATQNYVAGIVESLKRTEHYEQIWHDGYERGTEVQIYAQENMPVVDMPKDKEADQGF